MVVFPRTTVLWWNSRGLSVSQANRCSIMAAQIVLITHRRFQHVDPSLDHEPAKLMLQRVSRKIRHRVNEALALEI